MIFIQKVKKYENKSFSHTLTGSHSMTMRKSMTIKFDKKKGAFSDTS